MMNFIKNYLLLVLMGIGFVVVFGSLALFSTPVEVPPKQQGEVSTEIVTLPAPIEDGIIRPTQPLTIEKMDGGIVNFNVEIAKTDEELKTGLMERTSLPEDHGMLFVFKDVADRSFWMKNVKISLDLLFIDKDGTIHHIHPKTIPGDTSSHRSNGPVAHVLEIGGGVAEKLGIEVGDKVIHPDIH